MSNHKEKPNEVFERLMGTRVAQEDRTELVGAVLIFQPDVDLPMATALLEKLAPYLKDTTVQTFDPVNGSPVWYIP